MTAVTPSNAVATPSDIVQSPLPRLKITEIFTSLQGEADTAGWPTVFVRLTGCPLRCQYCDTAYAFHGGTWWDIDDIVAGTMLCLDQPPLASACPNGVAARVYNIGCSHPVKLMDFISEIESALGIKAQMIMKPMQPGDVYMTNADTTKLEQEIGYKPRVRLHEGITRFISWYQSDKNPLR